MGYGNMIQWTKPYMGVEHVLTIKGKHVPYQITVTKYLAKAHAAMFNLDAKVNPLDAKVNPAVFTPVKEFWGSYAEAKAKSEEWAKALIQ
jgi:hypothetical protein